MRYLVDDEIVVDSDIVVKSNPIVDTDIIDGERVSVDSDIVAPYTVIKEYIPIDIPPTVSPLEIVDYSSSSIECAFDVTTQQAEEVVRGVLCGTTNPPTFENADYRLLHGQGSMDLAFAGLEQNTEYYLRPYALSNLGYKYGDVVSQRTKNNPIPDEYQLVEYLESSWEQYIITNVLAARNIGVYLKAMPLTSQPTSFGQSNGNRFGFSLFYQNRIVLYYNTIYYVTAIPVSVGNIYEYVFNYNNDGRLGLINNYVTPQYADPSHFALFAFGLNYNGPAEMAPQRIYQLIITEDTSEIRNMYPVYRKADNKPGMYDLVNNQFYVNQGTGEFTVGQDKEWEE